MKADRFGQRVRRPKFWQLGYWAKYLRHKLDRWREGWGYNYDE